MKEPTTQVPVIGEIMDRKIRFYKKKPDYDRELLEDYTNFLCKWHYTDSDVWAEEPKAVDRYLQERATKLLPN